VISGEIEVRAGLQDGREIRFAAAGVGGVVGEMGVLDGLPRSADIVAARRTQLWRIPRSTILALLKAEPGASLALIGELARRLRAANEALQIVTLQDLGARLARLLINEAGSSGLVALTQTEMARRISASREKVNRKLHAFAASGLIALTKSGVRLLDPGGLAHLLTGSRT
jgi:CRP/FNR family cyclic AMP-dependent transcriptional regulator